MARQQTPTTGGQSAYVVRYSTDGRSTWNVLEKMGIAQMLPDGAKTTYDFLVGPGYGKPEMRRLPYADYGLVSVAAITGNGPVQTIATLSLVPVCSPRLVRRRSDRACAKAGATRDRFERRPGGWTGRRPEDRLRMTRSG